MKRNKWLLSLLIGLLCCGSAYAQTTVKGKITSEGGEPLIGATVAVKNSTDGTVTDIDGNYSLKTKKTLTQKDLLVFSYNRQIKKFPTEKQNVSLKHILT